MEDADFPEDIKASICNWVENAPLWLTLQNVRTAKLKKTVRSSPFSCVSLAYTPLYLSYQVTLTNSCSLPNTDVIRIFEVFFFLLSYSDDNRKEENKVTRRTGDT